jgi:hypothetical protein
MTRNAKKIARFSSNSETLKSYSMLITILKIEENMCNNIYASLINKLRFFDKSY